MMETTSKFIIRRRDSARPLDDLVIDSDSLLIGRLIQNDLVLNNRAVSRTHAGIKQLGNDYWIYNLSTSNGTVLNGELVERTPLAENDVIQIGPFLLKVNYGGDALLITVERELEVKAAKGQTGMLSLPSNTSDPSAATLVVNIAATKAKPIVTPGGTQRLSAAGFLKTSLPGMNERALKLFWDKRKREAGKLQGETPLHPKGVLKFGKEQYNWRPTLDLRKLWRKSYWYWGALVIGVFAVVAAFVYPDTYSPGEVSAAHTATAVSKPGLAFRPNANSCNECHNVVTGVQNKCIECHNTAGRTPVAAAPSFSPQTLITGHLNGQVTACNLCHTEHQGRESEAGLLNYGLCINCHNGQYTVEAGPNQGQRLPVPHGGADIGLPQLGVDYKWPGWRAARWQQALDRYESKELGQAYTAQKLESLAPVGYVKSDQFHLLHYLGKVEDKESCIICHKDARGNLYLDAKSPAGIQSLRVACLKCHASNEATPKMSAGDAAGATTTQLANCITCHKQHPNESPLAAAADRAKEEGARSLRDVSKVFTSVQAERKAEGGGQLFSFAGTGTATTIRQEKDIIRFEPDSDVGAVPLFGWVATLFALPALTLIGLAIGTARRKHQMHARVEAKKPGTVAIDPKAKAKELRKANEFSELRAKWLASLPPEQSDEMDKIDLDLIVATGPRYAYPVVNMFTCIGCHACVEACPADVLEIVNGISVPVRADQCMDDTSCQVACPTNPKSCIVINTSKTIPPREVPARDPRLETNVKGVYMIGDVSGVPLIKNAINEGALVMDKIEEDLRAEGTNANAEYDVAIIGIGPGGLSAAVIAKQRGLRYVAVEQGKIVDTIQQAYPAGKYVFYKPDTMPEKGGIPLPGPGDTKEAMLKGWFDAMMQNRVVINEDEMCKSIKPENGVFVVHTERGNLQEKETYRARRVILAIGNRGTPMKLRVSGEELKITVQPPPIYAKFCNKCGTPRRQGQKFCNTCGEKINVRLLPPTEDSKVKYRLADPDEFVKKKCIVVGAGNSAIEAAVDLAGLKREGDRITFVRDNEVILVIRSELKGDLKLGNKMNLFDCIDAGKIKAMYRTQIKEIHEHEVVLMDGSGKETARVENDYIFALIGGERPTKFLKEIGITIEGEKS